MQIQNHALYYLTSILDDLSRGCKLPSLLKSSESISEAVGDVAPFLLVSPVCLIIRSLSRLAAMDFGRFLVSRLARWMQRLQSASETLRSLMHSTHTHTNSQKIHMFDLPQSGLKSTNLLS